MIVSRSGIGIDVTDNWYRNPVTARLCRKSSAQSKKGMRE